VLRLVLLALKGRLGAASSKQASCRRPQRAPWGDAAAVVGSLDTGISRDGLYRWCTNAAPACRSDNVRRVGMGLRDEQQLVSG